MKMGNFKQGWAVVFPPWRPEVRNLCIRPYYNHRKGCPNYGKKNTCPPKAPFWSEVYHLGATVFVIWNCFDFAGHIQRMKQKHPNWSQRQLECCLYWQPKARKALREIINKFREKYPKYVITESPEAMGINVTATMRQIGIELEWPPKTKTYQIALAGLTWEEGINE